MSTVFWTWWTRTIIHPCQAMARTPTPIAAAIRNRRTGRGRWWGLVRNARALTPPLSAAPSRSCSEPAGTDRARDRAVSATARGDELHTESRRDDHVDVNWVPPKSVAARTEWAKAHPWIAGCFAGLLFSAIWTPLTVTRGTLWTAVIFGLGGWFGTWILFAVGTKRGWGERPDAKNHPTPTLRRPLSRASDRFLLWAMLLSIAAGLSWAGGLATGSDSVVDGILGLAASAWVAGATWAERRRRRSDETSAPGGEK